MAPRARIAPSPTGSFHLGTGRTALYNYLLCKQTGGTFILRVEDTDVERNVPEHVDGILAALDWLGIGFDEGPYFQSSRRQRHVEAALDLAERGLAYWSDPMPDGSRYDGRDRDRGLERAPGRALRFRTPHEGTTTVVDVVRGEPTFDNSTIEDFALLKGNGDPLFILGNVVDDMDQAITHVIRGDDHLTNTPKYLLLWRAIGGPPEPVFAHLPLIVNAGRKKLSKRRPEDRASLEDYRLDGYLPETMVNMLALCGWGPKDGDERLDLDRLVAEFRLEDVVPSPAFFDLKKLDAFNAERLREMSVEAFIDAALPWLRDEVPERPTPWRGRAPFHPERWAAMAAEVQTRVVRLADVASYVDFLMLAEPDWDEASWQKAVRQTDPHTAELLAGVRDRWADPALDADPDALGRVVQEVGERLGLNLKKAQAPVRVAITGRAVGPPLWQSVAVLGLEAAVARLEAASARLGGGA